MVKVKKNTIKFIYFVILLTFFSLTSCESYKGKIYEVKGSNININENQHSRNDIENFVAPFRNHINKDLDSILAYNPVDQDKSKGKWQSNIGNLLAETTLALGDKVFEMREHKSIDFCILNHGGIRSVIPKGNVTTRTAYEVMPFENSLIVAELKGSQIREIADYLLENRKPHPLAGITIYISEDEKSVDKILIRNKPLEDQKTYYVATSDYLANGGDNMTFFTESPKKYDLDYKLRNLLIDYFKSVDTLPNLTDKKIIIE
ncbi:5'-nucleotidase C-terminal domain-containing protein [Flavobacterium sp. NRK F10]|uniref:5'-Nucleotidase C-terminal domain-containing protein n=1 Tax=Flavobacterium sediminis TaxID=2201181 RepID=A0A2U8QWE7_9FLAO|nr:5'-nucleotidase [Flavobacterium sp. NRK F10]AWM14530.1 hypothetical protein DI487_12125 [Flavobacterium sediminis]MCO6175763.1 5'-nucleotidase C-terminal domain-containing protein [Flavobacterium sp. NRK F10]